MSALNVMLGIIFFLFPYLIYIYLLKRLKVGNILIVLFVGFSCLAFCFAFFVGMDRSLYQLLGHILQPTVKFYGQYYAVLGVSFVSLPLCNYLIDKIQKTKVLKIYSFAFFLCSIFLLSSLLWISARYPIEQPRTVFFVLNSPVDGSIQIGQIISACISIVLPLVSFVLLFFCMNQFGWLRKINRVGWNCVSLVAGGFFCFSIIGFSLKTKIWEYPKIIMDNSGPPTFSEFYDKEFVTVNFDDLVFPKEKRNLILIFLESMESSFVSQSEGGMMESNLILNLTRIASENIVFSHNENTIGGGVDVEGTSWTIAALISKLGGLPFNPVFMDANPSISNTFLPKLTTLTDVLQGQGYAQRFIFGSTKDFASRGVFFESHGEVEVHDIDWYKDQGMLPEDYDVFWGFEDRKLYEYAKMELNELAAGDSPFFFGMLTVDTHSPEGYICPDCVPAPKDSQMQTVIRCADRQIGSFMEWLSDQPFYDNTTVVIMGDHLFMNTDSSKLFGQDQLVKHNNLGGVITDRNTGRRWLNIFINSAKEPSKQYNRVFSSFDIFPSILESLGVTVPGGALGFGRSLFGAETTLLEKYDVDYVNTEIMRKSTQYLDLLYE